MGFIPADSEQVFHTHAHTDTLLPPSSIIGYKPNVMVVGS